jgi:PPOX class probable F420-dependent enzyme
MTNRAPKPSRMTTPDYGFESATSPPGERFPWTRAQEALAGARNYWIATASAGGRPHAAPVWALWLDGAVYFSTGKESRKARNLAANPNVVVHIESPNGEIVIVEGRAEEISDEATLKPVWDAYKQKYNWDIAGYPFYAVRPRIAFSFEEQLGETATRWTFES